MILLSILLFMGVALLGLVILAVSTVGSIAIVIFGDVIVCIVFIVIVAKWLVNRKMKKRRKK